jgi:hypothetical protein
VAGSVDLDNLEKDLDEIEISLGHLKNTKDGVHKKSRQGSNRSQLSEISQLGERSQSNERFQFSDRGLLGEELSQGSDRYRENERSQGSKGSLGNEELSQSSENYRRNQMENIFETDNSSSYRSMPVGDENSHNDSQDIETRTDYSGFMSTAEAMEVGLGEDIITADRELRNIRLLDDQRSEEIPSEYIRSKYRSDQPDTVNKPDLGVHALLTSGVIPLDIALDIVHGYPGSTRGTGDSFKDHKFQENTTYNNHSSATPLDYDIDGRDVAINHIDDCYGTLHQDSPVRPTSGYVVEPALSIEARSPYIMPTTPGRLQHSFIQQPADVSMNYESSSGITPKAYSPLRAFGNVRNLFTSHMDKVTHSAFDQSIEMSSPYRLHLDLNAREDAKRKSAQLSKPYVENELDSKTYPRDDRRVNAVSPDLRNMYGHNSEGLITTGTYPNRLDVVSSHQRTTTQTRPLGDLR